jgi:hypothetical protein
MLLGALTMAAAVIGLFFLRYWRKTTDRLFLFFAIGFWLMAFNWLALGFVNRNEPQTALYAVRVLAFGVILVGIWDKNRMQARARGLSLLEHDD